MSRENSHSKSNTTASTNPDEFVNQAYDLKDDEGLRAFYAKWASDYDNQMIGKLKYASPRLIAEAMKQYLPDTKARILDIGCGTGLTAKGLFTAGYQYLYGVDLSPEMIKVADSRGLYQDLAVADLNQPLDYADSFFGGAISSGTFTHGHVGSDPLHEICRIIRPGGVLSCTVHMDLWETADFKTTFNQLVANGTLKQLSLKLDRYYDEKKPEGWFCVYQKQ